MGVIFMGWSRKRSGQKRKDHYTAYYRDARGKTCDAGTFSNKKDADNAWKAAEVRLAEGRLGDPRRGRQTFQRYVAAAMLTARSAGTTPAIAGAHTAKERSLPTGLVAGLRAKMSRGSPGSPTPMGTFPGGGSASTSGCRRSKPRTWESM